MKSDDKTNSNITENKKPSKVSPESEQQYKSLFEKISAVMLVINPDNAAIVDANPAACAYYGWSREQMKKKRIDEINTLSAKEVRTEMQNALKEKRSRFLFKHRLADGTIRDVEVYSSPIETGGDGLLFSIIHDVTDRNQAEGLLQETKEKYQALAESISDVFFAMDKNLRYTYWNKASEKLTGIPSEKAIGKTLMETFPDNEARRQVKEMYLRVIKDKKPHFSTVTYPGDVQIIHEISVYPTAEGVSVFIKDGTERKKIETLLLKEKQEQQIILDSVPAWIFYKDSKNNFIRVNKTFADAMGVPKNKLEGKSLFDIFPKVQAEKFLKDDKEVIESGKPKVNILESVKFPKGALWVQTDKIPYRDDKGNIIGIIGFTLDITNSKKAEEDIKAKIAEIEENNKLMIGRELKMVDLKKENEELKKKNSLKK